MLASILGNESEKNHATENRVPQILNIGASNLTDYLFDIPDIELEIRQDCKKSDKN